MTKNLEDLMKLPEYVTKAEVQRVCAELGISDWTKKKKADVLPDEAKIIFGHESVARTFFQPNRFPK